MTSPFSLFLFGLGGVLLVLAAVIGVGLFTFIAPNNVLTMFAVALVCALMGAIFIAFGAILRTRSRARQYAPGSRWDEIGGYTPNAIQSGSINDIGYQYIYRPPTRQGKQTIPPSLTIEVPFDTAEEFEVVREGWFDRLCKKLGIASEVQTGSPEFDAAVYLRTDYPAFVEALFGDAGKRDATLAVMNAGFSSVTLKDRKLVATWHGFHPSWGDPGTLVPDIAASLFTLRDNPPPESPEALRPRGTQTVRLTLLWAVVVLLFLSLASFFFYQPMRSNDVFFKSLSFSGPGWLGFVWLSALLLRGHSRSHYRWATLIGVGGFAFLFGGVGATNLVNGTFDDSPRVTRIETITGKETNRSKRSTTYRVYFPSKGRPGASDSITVSANEWNGVVLNRSQVELVTTEGALGIEVLRDKRLLIQPKK